MREIGEYYYDFHLHSCLSPCGDDEMTPNNLVNMAKLMGLQVIALTDHNTCRNCQSAMKVGEKIGICVVPGMELCTAEEIHVVCLFPAIKNAMDFSEFIKETMPKIENKKEVFGNQLVMDENDNVIDEEKILLTLASSVSIDEVYSLIQNYQGICFPAHLDRSSYSALAVLGSLAREMNFKWAEFTFKADIKSYQEKDEVLGDMKILQNSDAHYLENINEKNRKIFLKENTPKGVIDALK